MANPRWNTERATRLGSIVTETRLAQGLTQQALADASGISMPTVSVIERTGNARESSIVKVLAALGLTERDVYGASVSLNAEAVPLAETIAPAINPEIERFENLLAETTASHRRDLDRLHARYEKMLIAARQKQQRSDRRAEILEDIVYAYGKFEVKIPEITGLFCETSYNLAGLLSAMQRLSDFDEAAQDEIPYSTSTTLGVEPETAPDREDDDFEVRQTLLAEQPADTWKDQLAAEIIRQAESDLFAETGTVSVTDVTGRVDEEDGSDSGSDPD